MSKRFLYIQLLLFSILYFLIWIYDLLVGGNDGVIAEVYFHRVLLRLLLFLVIFNTVLYFSGKKGSIKTFFMNILVFMGLFLFLEVSSFVYVKITKPDHFVPSHIIFYDNPKYMPYNVPEKRFWGDIDEVIGRWRPADKVYIEMSCDDGSEIIYRTNSYGARDKEWENNDSLKIAFLGDSFIEAVVLNEENRLSNLLEEHTGVTHMNLGVLGANPLAYYLAYNKIVAPNFNHQGIIVGIFQGNDFDYFGYPVNAGFLNQPIYRAYWNTDSSKNEVNYSMPKSNDSYESFYIQDHQENLRPIRDSIYHAQRFSRKIMLELETNSYLYNRVLALGKKVAVMKREGNYEGFYGKPEWGTRQTYDFLKSFDSLVRETTVPILFVIIPDLYDVENFKDGKGENLFTPYFKNRYDSDRVMTVDLLPAFVQAQESPDSFYIPCDGHWNAKGNKWAKDYLVTQPEYQQFMEMVRR